VDRREPEPVDRRLDLADAAEELEERNMGCRQGRRGTREGLQPLDVLRSRHHGADRVAPRADQTIEVNPLVPEGRWDWFCLDHVAYHGRLLTIVYDRTGAKYGRARACASSRTARKSPRPRNWTA